MESYLALGLVEGGRLIALGEAPVRNLDQFASELDEFIRAAGEDESATIAFELEIGTFLRRTVRIRIP